VIAQARYSCFTKFDYRRRNTAEKAAQRIRRRRDDLVTAYKCKLCHGWHIGETNGRIPKPQPAPITVEDSLL
jgi:hypothetical protein